MLWIKSFHIIFMVCWFAGLFYLPRLFVYHAEATDDTSLERFIVMERRLYRGITTPSMLLTLAMGLWLIHFNTQYYMQAGWFHAKLGCVLILLAYHFTCGYFVKQFRLGKNTRSHVFYRFFNEFPVFLLVVIIILVVVKPF